MDQRLRGSLGRFLQRRAIENLKNPLPVKKLPWNYFWEVRFKFSLGNHSLIMRAGLFGLELYWGAVVPLWNNVSVSEKRTGVMFYPIFRVVPGATYRCFRWLKAEVIDDCEDVQYRTTAKG
jgi:hypothetical protein